MTSRSENRKRWRLLAVAGAFVLSVGTAVGVRAQETTQEPAPPGESEAVAAEVEGIAAVGRSHAEADGDGGEARGHALELFGEPPSEAFGGSQKGEGTSEGALLDTGDTPLGRAQVLPWEAAVGREGNTQEAQGAAAAARAVLPDGLVTLAVLQSESHASHTGGKSAGSASSDGAFVNLGGEEGVTVRVLHAETSSEGEGRSYLLGIGDTHVLTSDDTGGRCAIEVPSLARVVCLSASGGEGGIGDEPVTASVADATVGGDDGLVAGLVGASSEGSTATQVSAGATTPPSGGPARGALAATGGPGAVAGATALLLVVGATVVRAVRYHFFPSPEG
jgi:hypothetical protein